MKLIKTAVIGIIFLGVAACGTLRKRQEAITAKNTIPPIVTSQATVAVPEPPKTNTSPPPKARNGVFAPGDEELAAIKPKHPKVTMQTLTDGYALYTGTCTGCHDAKGIYSIPEETWAGIIDDMAPKASLNAAQKNAVYKYVLAIKVTQLKESWR